MDEAAFEELFASLGSISIRRMFGGQGVYHGGRIIAVVIGGELHLKTDGETAARFEAAGARRWTYQRPGKSPVGMPYHSLPDEAYDNPDTMADWARLAVEASLRAGETPAGRCRSGKAAGA